MTTTDDLQGLDDIDLDTDEDTVRPPVGEPLDPYTFAEWVRADAEELDVDLAMVVSNPFGYPSLPVTGKPGPGGRWRIGSWISGGAVGHPALWLPTSVLEMRDVSERCRSIRLWMELTARGYADDHDASTTWALGDAANEDILRDLTEWLEGAPSSFDSHHIGPNEAIISSEVAQARLAELDARWMSAWRNGMDEVWSELVHEARLRLATVRDIYGPTQVQLEAGEANDDVYDVAVDLAAAIRDDLTTVAVHDHPRRFVEATGPLDATIATRVATIATQAEYHLLLDELAPLELPDRKKRVGADLARLIRAI